MRYRDILNTTFEELAQEVIQRRGEELQDSTDVEYALHELLYIHGCSGIYIRDELTLYSNEFRETLKLSELAEDVWEVILWGRVL